MPKIDWQRVCRKCPKLPTTVVDSTGISLILRLSNQDKLKIRYSQYNLYLKSLCKWCGRYQLQLQLSGTWHRTHAGAAQDRRRGGEGERRGKERRKEEGAPAHATEPRAQNRVAATCASTPPYTPADFQTRIIF